MSTNGWIGVDLDGTLAHYDGWKGELHIGAPIAPMVERVKQWLAEGREVRVFTARVASQDITGNLARAPTEEIRSAISLWCLKHIGTYLPVTNVKDFRMVELWDDRAVRVRTNTGERCCE